MQPITPDAHGIAVLCLTVFALFLFTRDKIPLESSSLAILIILVVGFELLPYERGGERVLGVTDFFAGFGNEALVTICALMMVGKALETTGALQPLANVVGRAWQTRPVLALLTTLVAGAILSAFMNNTPIVVLLMPILVGASLRSKFPVSGVMMPMGLATIVGGMSTTIGTSTNLLVVGISQDLGMHTFTMFEWVFPVAVVGGVALLFLWLVAPRLLPDRTPPMADTTPRIFSAQLHVKEGGFADGKALSEVLAKTGGQMRIDKIQRSESLVLAKLPSVKLQPGDQLFVKDSPENLKHYEQLLGMTLFNISDIEHPVDEETPLRAEGQQLAEVVVTRGSPLHLRSLAAARFSSSYGLMPLALHRARAPSSQVTGDLNMIRLRAGDVLLVQGSSESISKLKDSGSMLVLDGTTDLPHTHNAKRALAIMAFVVLAAALRIMPISVSAMVGLGLMIVTSCLGWRDAVTALSIPVVMIIVTALALGKALMGTGMADFVAMSFVGAASGLPTPIILSAFLLLMTLMTNVVSNNAAAVIGTPIAIGIAQQLGVSTEPFILAVIFGANMSFATPYGYQTNLLILSAGGYTFSDFLRVGIPLTIIMWIGFSVILPVLYPL
ncbi:MAG: SLC13 family permease [Gammaproteobacteria bacterium]|nr:SLC13 family permease [Gammaproteobacteria bacterium]MDH3373686.1 SLC13 family permease [Gammaproteobacteria bacterium]MDH3408039.1 SLC13 family permease [Gammaproteobacteria bacterium]MDH3551239.1 SLC13 family permease [Gammaproteobacteria bacterium]